MTCSGATTMAVMGNHESRRGTALGLIQFLQSQLEESKYLSILEPGSLMRYLGILSFLIFLYYREASEVYREYGRLHREIVKEPTLQCRYDAPHWKQRLDDATHIFNLGSWLILTSILLLTQFVGMMVMLQAQPSDPRVSSGRPTAVSAASAVTYSKREAGISIAHESRNIRGSESVQRSLQARDQAQRLLGLAFIVFCVAVALRISRMKYEALRTMYEFSNFMPPQTLSMVPT